MMAQSPLGDVEDLTLCSYCKQPFTETEQQPKVLSCKHYFCLKCVSSALLKGRELYCVHCWKRTEVPDMAIEALPTNAAVLALMRRIAAGTLPPKPPDKPPPAPAPAPQPPPPHESCHTHAMPFSLWCLTCAVQLCRACAAPDHSAHLVKTHHEAKQLLRTDVHNEIARMHKTICDLQHLVFKQRDFLLKILEACTTLKTQVETDLVNNLPSYELSEARDALNKAKQSFTTTEHQSPAEIHTMLSNLSSEKDKLQSKQQEMLLQCKLDDLIKNATVLFDFELLKRALANLHSNEPNVHAENGFHNPILFLANYCMSQLYSRHCLMKQQQNNNQYPHSSHMNGDYNMMSPVPGHSSYMPMMVAKTPGLDNGLMKPGYHLDQLGSSISLSVPKPSPVSFSDPGSSSPNLHKSFAPYNLDALTMALPGVMTGNQPILSSPSGLLVPQTMMQHSPQSIMRNPSSHIYPVFYFNIEINGNPFGRFLVEVRTDIAPKMAKNFGILATGELGIGYKGCTVFQCWENESIITGDFELNNGRGGRSIFEDNYFLPDDTKIMPSRGAVGMRRSQRRHDNLGLVGSQFRVVLREMRGFSGIFAFVVEGIEVVDRMSQTGDSAGKPQSTIVIANCGKLN